MRRGTPGKRSGPVLPRPNRVTSSPWRSASVTIARPTNAVPPSTSTRTAALYCAAPLRPELAGRDRATRPPFFSTCAAPHALLRLDGRRLGISTDVRSRAAAMGPHRLRDRRAGGGRPAGGGGRHPGPEPAAGPPHDR